MAMMQVSLRKSLVDEIIKIVTTNLDAEEIILFGSRTNGKSRKTSDIDIAIKSKESPLFVKEILDEDLETLLKVDVVDINTVDKQFKRDILANGIVLYEKTSKDISRPKKSG